MEQKEMRALEALCTQEQPQACMAACPMHVDASGMLLAVENGDMEAAYGLYAKTVGLPQIIARVCDAPCQCACVRKDAGGTIAISRLERVIVDQGVQPHRKGFLKKRSDRVAVIGSELNGLVCALELLKKGCAVEVLEQADKPGGRLRERPELTDEIIAKDLETLKLYGGKLSLGADAPEVDRLLEDFDAVYVALAERAEAVDEATLQSSDNPKLFMTRGDLSTSREMEDGRRAAISIDRFLQGVSLTSNRENEGCFETTLFTSLKDVRGKTPAEGEGADWAKAEAARCIHCECMECVKVCAFMRHYKSYPKRYVREVHNNMAIVNATRPSNTMINSCTDCGLCAEVCPNDLDLGEIMINTRREMAKTNKMPQSLHDFALKDMEHAMGEAAFLQRNAEGKRSSKYAFFPGCQLSALSPNVVERAYGDLLGRFDEDCGLMLGCCGIIADWAGRTELFSEKLSQLDSAWEALDKPELIVGCPSCYEVFKANRPQYKARGIWDVLAECGLPEAAKKYDMPIYIHDACTTRHESGVQHAVRQVVEALGFTALEPPLTKETTQCCGYGGAVHLANREVAKEITDERLELTGGAYLTYCINCRDRFTRGGGRAAHLLELIYADDAFEKPSASWSERQTNRERLKLKMSGEIYEAPELKLYMTDEVRERLNDRLILDSDVIRTIDYAERENDKFLDSKTGQFVACHNYLNVYFWIYYAAEADGYRVHNAYSHRMRIVED